MDAPVDGGQFPARRGAGGPGNARTPDPAAREIVRAWRALTGGRGVRDADRRTLVACSGGADSTALVLCLVAAAREHVVVGHVVHDLRAPDEAEADATAVASLCDRLGVALALARIEVRGTPGNAESAARRARYRALSRLAQGHGCGVVATGHQGDDLLETMLMRLVRGAGVGALAGMAASRPLESLRLVRPMLGVTRADAERVCRAGGVRWRDDATNQDATRWRARLRRDVVPVLRDLRKDVHRRASDSATMLRAAAALVEREARIVLAGASRGPGRVQWTREALGDLGPAVLSEIVRLGRHEVAGEPGADRLHARTVARIVAGLRAPDRRAREWTCGGVRIRADRQSVRIDALGTEGGGSIGI